MQDRAIRRLTLGGVLAAAIVLLTTLASLPMPGGLGYINLGDLGVLLSGALLGGWWGALCAGTASALADLLLGYAVYAPATFVIKGCAALLSWLLIGKSLRRGRSLWFYTCVLTVPLGYFLYEALLYGLGAASPNLLFNALQGGVGAVGAHAVYIVLNKSGFMKQGRID